MIENVKQGQSTPFAIMAGKSEGQDLWTKSWVMNAMYDKQLSQQERMGNPISFEAEEMGGKMYFHQALKQPDANWFVHAIVQEINGHLDKQNLKVVKCSKIPKYMKPLLLVWAMRRKRNIVTNEVTKHKASLNTHGGFQEFGVNYFETYATVVTWCIICLIIV